MRLDRIDNGWTVEMNGYAIRVAGWKDRKHESCIVSARGMEWGLIEASIGFIPTQYYHPKKRAYISFTAEDHEALAAILRDYKDREVEEAAIDKELKG